MELFVSSIQHFSVGDGEGIRTTVFLKGCNLKCPWCHNPETVSSKPVTLNYASGEQKNGIWMPVDKVAEEVSEDKAFYGNDGGVTVSGGEPMLQADAVRELLHKLKNDGITNVVDTAGFVKYENFLKLKGIADTYFFDLKAADEIGYDTIGGDFNLVFSNLKNLISDKQNVHVRIPLIPEFNNSPEYSRRICNLLLSAGAENVDLLPFHRLGSGKYDAMSIPYAYRDRPSMSVSEAEETAKIYRQYFNVKIEK